MHTQELSQEPDRVRRNTAPEILKRIDSDLELSVRFHASQPTEVISRRIEELEREWDIERTLETNAATLALTGAFMGLTSGRKWFLLTLTVTGFLLQHAVSGWCPPVPVFRRLGFRTRSEIDREKFALKALRGDFKNLPEREEPQPEADIQQVVQSITE
jgi:hypothetical protein